MAQIETGGCDVADVCGLGSIPRITTQPNPNIYRLFSEYTMAYSRGGSLLDMITSHRTMGHRVLARIGHSITMEVEMKLGL